MWFVDDRGRSLFDIFNIPFDGQINCGVIHPNVVKGFHRHKYQDDLVTCISGSVKLALYSDEEGLDLINLNEHTPITVRIKAGVWHGYKCNGDKEATILYYVTKKYDPKNPDEERAPYDAFHDWKVENK